MKIEVCRLWIIFVDKDEVWIFEIVNDVKFWNSFIYGLYQKVGSVIKNVYKYWVFDIFGFIFFEYVDYFFIYFV